MTPLRFQALLAVALAAPGVAQIRPGHFLAVGDPPAAGLFLFEPLAATLTPIADPQGVLARALHVALGASADRVLVAVAAGTGTTAMVIECVVQGNSLATLQPWTRDLGETIVGLGQLENGLLAIATPTRLLAAPPGVSVPVQLAPAPLGTTFVQLAVAGDRIAALARGASSTTTLVLAQPSTSTVSTHPLGIPGSRSLAFDALRGAILVGDAFGNLWLVDLQRFIASFAAGPLPGPALAIGGNRDDESFVIATHAGLFRFDGAGLVGPTPAPPFSNLDYQRYTSRFSTFGTGCSAASIAPAAGASGRPYPGSLDFSLRMTGGSPSSAAFLLLGLLPANLPLDPTGMAGCTLFVQPLDASPYPTSLAGVAAVRLPIPPIASLAGNAMFCQWIATAPRANALGLLASNGGRIEF